MIHKIALFIAVSVLVSVTSEVRLHAQTFKKENPSVVVLPGNGTDVAHTLTIIAPTLSGSSTLTLPGSNAIGVLLNNGSGGLSWLDITGVVTNPMTSPGDMIYGGLLGFPTRLAATGTADRIILSGANAAPSWSTATYPATSGSSGNYLRSDGTNFVSSSIQANDVPPLNQNTTGSAAKLTTARTIAGNSFDGSANIALANKFIVQGTSDAGLSGAQFLGSLTTGLVKNTTATGVLSIATAGTDYSAGTSGLATGILKSTTATGALTIAVAGDFPTLNQNTTGTANIAGGTVGAIPYQTAANATSVLAATATANQVMLSGANAAPAWSTATYPATTTVNQLLYSNAANTVTGLATANNGVLITSSGGVPSISSTLPSAVQATITSLGTIGSGVWNGTAIGVAYGGTGGSSGAWGLSGNTGIAAGSYLGTTDAKDLVFKTVGATAMTIGGASNAGNVGIGTATTTNTLAVGGNIQMTNSSNDKITTNNSDMVIEQTGDTYGTTRLHIQNRNGSNCALFEQAGSVNLADFGFKPGSGVQSNVRLEDRPGTIRNTANNAFGEFEFFMNTLASGGAATYNFSTGEGATTIELGNVGIGLVNPSQKLTLYNGNLLLSNNGTADEVEFQGTSTGISTFQAGAQGATNYNYTLPITAPAANQVLTVTAYAAPAVTLGWSTPLSNPMTSPGDMIAGGAAGAPARVAATATANQILLSGSNASPAWSSATYPATTTINQLLFSNSANTVTGLSTANYGILNTSSSGVPSINTAPIVSGVIQSGVPSSNTGGLALANASSSYLTTIEAGNATAAATYTLPTAPPATSGEYLTSSTSGGLSWINSTGSSSPYGASNGTFISKSTADATISSTTAVPVGGLSFPIAAGQVTSYRMEVSEGSTNSQTTGIYVGVSVPSGATINGVVEGLADLGANGHEVFKKITTSCPIGTAIPSSWDGQLVGSFNNVATNDTASALMMFGTVDNTNGTNGMVQLVFATGGTATHVIHQNSFVSAWQYSQPSKFDQIYTSSSSLTVPAGVTTIYINGAGGAGGGGGGGGKTANGSFGAGGGGGGGAGGYVPQTALTVSAGETLTITVGAAGTAGSGGTSTGTSGTNGGNGGTTTIVGSTSGTIFSAAGGTGGSFAANASTVNTTGGGAGAGAVAPATPSSGTAGNGGTAGATGSSAGATTSASGGVGTGTSNIGGSGGTGFGATGNNRGNGGAGTAGTSGYVEIAY